MSSFLPAANLRRSLHEANQHHTHSTRAESLSEHTCDTALLAHTLCLIARRYTGTPCRPKTVAVAALYHDAPEIITGDLPTPVKYHSATLRDAYKAMERESVASMTAMLPEELAEEVAPFLTGELLTAEETKLLKAADRLSALVKCLEEQRSGNHEFDAALAQQRAIRTWNISLAMPGVTVPAWCLKILSGNRR